MGARLMAKTMGNTMSLKVIGAGFGRTGTKSLKQALEDLGFGPCYHMVEAFAHPEHVPVWEAAAQGEPVEWEDIFRGYQSAVDWPAAAFYAQLMARYPDARVILTVRDPDRWYESVLNTLYAMGKLTAAPPMSWVEALFAPHRHRLIAVTSHLWDELFGGGSRIDSMRLTSSRGATRTCSAAFRPSGCWSTMSSRAGSRCARSWG